MVDGVWLYDVVVPVIAAIGSAEPECIIGASNVLIGMIGAGVPT